MRRIVLLAIVLVAPLAAEETPFARRMAVAMIAERARLVANAGDSATARLLDELAVALREDRIALPEALQLVQLHHALPPAQRRLPQAPTAQDLTGGVPPAGPTQLKGILDAEPVAPPAASPAAGQPAPTAQPTTASAAPTTPTPGAAAGALTATVLALRKGDDGRPAMVMIDAGSAQGVAPKQRFAIRRGTKTQVQVEVTDHVNPKMAACAVLKDTWIDQTSEIREGDEAVRLP